MNPSDILQHLDRGTLWTESMQVAGADLRQAYADALAVSRLRVARGERQTGFKIGFTNRTLWARYNVHAPIWGSVWDATLRHCEREATVCLDALCQPRIEPEIVFGFREAPAAQADLAEVFRSIAWVAVGFEVVQSHLKDWRFVAAQTIADGGLHGRLLVGATTPLHRLANSAEELDRLLARSTCILCQNGKQVDQGTGSNVLGSPLRAVGHFLQELRACPGARDIQPGDVVTTGTWTDAWPVQRGQSWSTRFSFPEAGLTVRFD